MRCTLMRCNRVLIRDVPALLVALARLRPATSVVDVEPLVVPMGQRVGASFLHWHVAWPMPTMGPGLSCRLYVVDEKILDSSDKPSDNGARQRQTGRDAP